MGGMTEGKNKKGRRGKDGRKEGTTGGGGITKGWKGRGKEQQGGVDGEIEGQTER